ncbi:hypothetical protein DFS33DRAFT_1453880 [Desarmillaria ectypa]|nr:hypothetical protein DFS33DRAFT_1453880 [Desarmillaria ectypa]
MAARILLWRRPLAKKSTMERRFRNGPNHDNLKIAAVVAVRPHPADRPNSVYPISEKHTVMYKLVDSTTIRSLGLVIVGGSAHKVLTKQAREVFNSLDCSQHRLRKAELPLFIGDVMDKFTSLNDSIFHLSSLQYYYYLHLFLNTSTSLGEAGFQRYPSVLAVPRNCEFVSGSPYPSGISLTKVFALPIQFRKSSTVEPTHRPTECSGLTVQYPLGSRTTSLIIFGQVTLEGKGNAAFPSGIFSPHDTDQVRAEMEGGRGVGLFDAILRAKEHY